MTGPQIIGLGVLVLLFFGAAILFIVARAGWHDLAKRFKADHFQEGQSFGIQSGFVNHASYRLALQFCVTSEGLGLKVLPVYRPGHPALNIPWSEIRPVREWELFGRFVELSVGSPEVARIKVPHKVWSAAKRYCTPDLP